MNKIDRSWSSLFYEEFFISSVPSSSAETAIYSSFNSYPFSNPITYSVAPFITIIKHGTAKILHRHVL
jgi:hypothetical protein